MSRGRQSDRRTRASQAGVVVGPPSFEEFFTQNRDPLYRAMCLITRDSHEAEDLMQEAFVRVYERWERVCAMASPTGYLFQVAMNSFRSLRRRAAVATRHLVRPDDQPDHGESIGMHDAIERALEVLSPRQRAVVVLVDMLGFGTDEAAEMLGVAPSTARVHLARARAALTTEMQEP